jgi:hypothetical protein
LFPLENSRQRPQLGKAALISSPDYFSYSSKTAHHKRTAPTSKFCFSGNITGTEVTTTKLAVGSNLVYDDFCVWKIGMVEEQGQNQSCSFLVERLQERIPQTRKSVLGFSIGEGGFSV